MVLNILFYGMCAAKITDDEGIGYQQKVFEELGVRIKAYRLKKGYKNYEAFAFQHNFSRAQIARYERGDDIRLSTLLRLLKALEVTPEEFFRGLDF